MIETWDQALDALRSRRVTAVQVAQRAEVSEKTVRNAIKGRNTPTHLNRKVITNAVRFFLSQYVTVLDSHKNDQEAQS